MARKRNSARLSLTRATFNFSLVCKCYISLIKKELRNETRELRKEKFQAPYFVRQKSYGHDICTSVDEVLRHFQI